jgi:hypothetical protein
MNPGGPLHIRRRHAAAANERTQPRHARQLLIGIQNAATPRTRRHPQRRSTPTPRGSDARGPAGHGEGGADLRTAIWLLPTPKASDGLKGCPAQRGSKGDLTLPSAAVRLDPGRTPAAGSVPCADEPDSTAASEPVATAPADGDPGSTSGSGHGWGPYAAAVARWESLLGRAAPPPTQPGQHGKPVLAPPFVEWLMGLDPGWVTDLGLPRTLALRVLGNGVVPQQAAVALQLLLCPYRWAVPV